MLNQNSDVWFVSLEDLLEERGAPLRSARSPLLETDQVVREYEEFTISLESFCISEQLDKKVDGNDLLVRTWTTYGQEPPIEIVHFFEKNVSLGAVKDNLVVEHMFASESYLGQPIELEVQILEVDGNKSIAEEIQAAAHLFGAVFPALLPFSSLAMGLYTHLKDIFRNPHDLAFSATLKLHGETGIQKALHSLPLRCGAYVLCNQAIQGNDYVLRELKLEAIAPEQQAIQPSYVVIKVVPQVINSLNSEDLLANQRLAASLLTSDEAEFELPASILEKHNRLAHSFELLRTASRDAYLVKQLIQYRQLRSLEQNSLLDMFPTKDALDYAEKLSFLAHEIKTFFLEEDHED